MIHPAIEITANIWTQNKIEAASFPHPLKLATAPVQRKIFIKTAHFKYREDKVKDENVSMAESFPIGSRMSDMLWKVFYQQVWMWALNTEEEERIWTFYHQQEGSQAYQLTWQYWVQLEEPNTTVQTQSQQLS